MARFTPEGFQPTKEKQEVSDLSSQYTFNPDSFDESKLDELELNASYYGVPFARSAKHQDNLLQRTFAEAGKGFVEGFSANLVKFDPPSRGDNVASISRQLGSLAGFMGYIPGGKYLPILNKLRGASLPLKAATTAQKAISKVANPLIKQASKETRDFLSGNVIADISAGAFQMGVASGVSGEWTEGVTTILKNAGYGAMYGGVARGIGNMTGLGKKIRVDQLNTATGAPQLSKLADGQKFDLSMRVLANGTFDALSAKMQGQTTPEQVYNFVMGGFLGWKDLPFSTRTSQEFIWKTIQDKHIEDPELHPEWDLYSKEMQDVIKTDMQSYFGPEETRSVVANLLYDKGVVSEEAFYKSIGKKFGIEFEKGDDGVPIQKVTEKMVDDYIEEYTSKGKTEDVDDLDMHIADVRDLVGKGEPVVSWVGRALEPKTEFDKIKISADLFKVWRNSFEEGPDGFRPNIEAENGIYRHIFNKYKIKLDEEGKGWWRRLGEEARNKVFVPQLTIVDGKPSFLSGNVNAVGNKKDVHFQRPIIGDILFKQYEDAGKKDFFTYLDHVIYEGKEYKLTELQDAIRNKLSSKDEELDSQDLNIISKNEYNKVLKDLDDYMDKKGFYFVGGKGDKNAMYFIQKHPFITSKLNKNGVGTRNVIKALYESDGKKYDSVDDFVKKYIPSGTKYDIESFASNILYDLTWNGFDVRSLGTGKKTFATDLRDKLQEMKDGDFLSSAKAYNKRAQIWFNTGISGDADNVSKLIKSLPVTNGKLRYKIFDDSQGGNLKGRGDEQEEFTDGAILGLKDVIRALNIDKGMPTSGNVNKSFIVDPNATEGSLLGKYMIHEPSKGMSEEMKSKGIHLYMPKSAVKQMGNRQFEETYELPIGSLRTTMSEITSDKYIKPQSLPKQIMTVLSAMDGGKDNSKLFKKMYDDFSGKGSRGTEEGVKIADNFLSDNNDLNTKKLIDNIEDVPIPTLFRILRDPTQEKASSGIMKKLLKINDDFYRAGAEESEFSRDELQNERLALAEYGTIVDRLMQIYPEGSTGGAMHKFVRDFRMVALRNYAVHSYTRPKLKGSVVARIRPWDKYMKQTMDDINDDSKQIFYLDNGFKKTKIYDDRFDNGFTTLENLLKMTKDKSLSKSDREDYLEMITALTTRVPMDSMSGASRLKLAGFTGIDGYGVLMHPRVMRALGGADLDGDKAFVFFGGKGGMKKEYKEMYQAARDEFFSASKSNKKLSKTKNLELEEQHNKNKKDILTGKPLRELFTETDATFLEQANDPINYYSSRWRGEMSNAASNGRSILGTAVNTRSAILGAYNAIVKMGTSRTKEKPLLIDRTLEDGSKSKVVIYQDKKGKIVYELPYKELVEITKNNKVDKEVWLSKRLVLKIDQNNPKAMQAFKERSRTAIAIGSDPMDEAGVKSASEFKKLLIEPLFESKMEVKKGKKWTKDSYGEYSSLINKSLVGDFLAVNNALYGKNRDTGQRHSYSDVKSQLARLVKLPSSADNNVMVNLAKDINKINWSDNLYRRVNFQSLERMYEEHRSSLDKYEWMKNILDRTSFAVTDGKLQKYVHNNNMWSASSVKKYMSNDNAWYELFTNAPKKKNLFEDDEVDVPYVLQMNETYSREILKDDNEEAEIKALSPEWRSSWIDYMVLKSEDMLINDMSDISTITRIYDIVKGKAISDSRINELFTRAEYIKNQSFHKAQQRKEVETERDFTSDEVRTLNKEFSSITDKASAGADNVLLDKMIKDFVSGADSGKKLTPLEKELFDTFLIGTLNKGDAKKLSKVKRLVNIELRKNKYKGRKNKTRVQFLEDIQAKLEKDAVNTSLMKVGLNSKIVDDSSIKKFFDKYDSLYKKVNTTLSASEIKSIEESLAPALGSDKITSLLTADGKRVEGSIIEESDLSKTDNKYLDERAPFIGITRGKVKDPDLLEAYEDIKRHLDQMHNVDAKNINFLFRGVIGKNINIANKIDMLAFRNYLDDMNTPSFWRRSWDYLTGKNPTEIKRAYYMQFPATVDKDLATSPAFRQLEKEISPYKDHLGNTIMGTSLTPMTPMGMIQQLSAKSTEMSQQVMQDEKRVLRDELLPYLDGIDSGRDLYDIAVAMREKTIANKKYKDEDIYLGEYINNWNEVEPMYNKLKDVVFKIPLAKGVQIMNGSEVISNINRIITLQNQKVHQWLVGDGETAKKWIDKAKDENGEVNFKGLQTLRKDWTRYVADKLRKNEPIPIEDFGVDGIRNITKYIVQSHIPYSFIKAKGGRKKLKEINDMLEVSTSEITGKFDFAEYFPHVGQDREKVKEKYKFALEKLKTEELTKKERNIRVKKLFTGHKKLTGDYLSKDEMGENFDKVEEIITALSQQRIEYAENILSSGLVKVGNQFSRESHIGGWSRTPEAYDSYMKNIVDTFYRQVMQTANRSVIHEFGDKFLRKTKDVKLTTAWRRFFQLYAQRAMGYPSHIPQKVMDDPLMKLSYTPYKFMSDSKTKERVDYIRKKLGIDRKVLKEYDLDDDTIDEMTGVQYSQIEAYSAMEAKWQLASLLAHPKSAVANFYGGTIHTVINTGWAPFKNARSIEYLKAKVNSKWNSMADVESWLQKLGVTEDFLMYEVGLNPNEQSSGLARMAKDVANLEKSGKEVSIKSLNEIRKKHKLSASAFKFASSFMRIPERALRRDAFMAHYLQARERFGNSIKDYDHPFLIEMAKKGVKATQFLYSAPYRPAWTTSSMGKVFSRFQLWSWNSVRFRRDTLRRAKIYGFVPGTEAHANAVRMIQADAFMLGMASVYTYSLFESALPAPYNWLQDTADYFFGDEEKKDRAFFGSPFGPFQLVTPPFLRALPQMFKWMLNKDEELMTEYVAWSLLPFGRIGRDIFGKGGIIENPYYAVTKMTGLPLIPISKDFKKVLPKKEKDGD